ncbi:anti-sigma factor domain-containing protein [Flavobacterium sp. ASW18X]|uniref:anti-sigma factor n=1 Tax=Flavobacterium sp. ASW18X TaxID=2572595 RepID=UPI0010AE96D3|nr:anti-sigma factor [Flavobacterium sp. ASW18X]TKD62580.1 anti-sigma factor [Flavobacterium sp. ASW18X]
MDTQEYIASGILELYVAGLLTAEENLQIDRYAQEYPEIKAEILAIEASILALSKAASPGLAEDSLSTIRNKTQNVIPITPVAEKRTNQNFFSYAGWAASVALAIGLFYLYQQNNILKETLEVTTTEKEELKTAVEVEKETTTKVNSILEQLRDQNVAVVALGGQAVAPESFAKVYWNTKEQKVVIDAQGLPEPPEGFTYQVWSLKLNPLTPTSLGLLDDFASNDTKLFELDNTNESQAFGITLEPAGGSESPTLEQLYTLGAVRS